jgi:hypothetical protein
LETHIEPINLHLAAVKEARNSDRRFCFEVITPNFRRMYQATSAEELSSWLATINNAISSLLHGTSSSVNVNENIPTRGASPTTLPTAKNWKRHQSRSFSGALSNLAAAKDKYLKKRRYHSSSAGGGTGGRKGGVYNISSPQAAAALTPSTVLSQQTPNNTTANITTSNSDLLMQLKNQDISNTLCADCSAKDPDWCSLNLGILICIGKQSKYLIIGTSCD